MTTNQFLAPVPDPNEHNTFNVSDFRKELTERLTLSGYSDVTTYVVHSSRNNREMGALVPMALVRDYVRLREAERHREEEAAAMPSTPEAGADA